MNQNSPFGTLAPPNPETEEKYLSCPGIFETATPPSESTGGTVRYPASQPWPFPHTLMIGCEVEVTGGEMRLDGRGLEEVRWLGRDRVRAYFVGEDIGLKLPPPLAIAHHLIKGWARKGD